VLAEQGTPLAELLRQAVDFGSAGSAEAWRALEVIFAQRMEDIPRERRAFRERGLYVDPSTDGSIWERPRDFRGDLAEQELYHALNDYSGLRANLAEAEQYADVRAALEEWPERPELPRPAWPR
jgi:hypothetical protein